MYPADGEAYAYMAKILPEYQNGRQPQGIAGNPVTLTVSQATRLLLNVSRSYNSTLHRIEGWLKYNDTGTGVPDKLVKVTINNTIYIPLTTGIDGYFNCSLTPKPGLDKNITYIIIATFEGDSPLSATAWAKTLDGQTCAACTTIQHGYRPSCNSTVLTVEPQATGTSTPTKSQEEMQKDAQDSGWLSISHEFSWWYPWYKLHIKVHINPTVEIGFNPLLAGAETIFFDGLEFFEALTEEAITDVILDMGALLTAYFFARGISFANPALGAALEFIKLGIQGGLLYVFDWADRGPGLLGASIGNLLMGLLVIRVDIAKTFLNALMRLCKWVASALMNIFNVLLDILKFAQAITRWWTDAIEVGGDFLLGGLGILRCMGVL